MSAASIAAVSSGDRSVAVIGGGPAGLMAAEVVRAAGHAVDLYDAMGSVGRKFLLAGKGGLNLTHGEDFAPFVARFRERRDEVAGWLAGFDSTALRAWASQLGVDTFVGSSGRVFPTDLKAAPLLRRWVRRLKDSGVRFHMQQRWLGWTENGELRFATADGERTVAAEATVLALGGASWPRLGSDGGWVDALRARGVDVASLRPANCGFEIDWSPHLRERHAGAPLKPVRASWMSANGTLMTRQGELIVTEHGVEGSLVYAMSADLRTQIEREGHATLQLDLLPGRDPESLRTILAAPRGKRTLSGQLRRAGIDALRAALLFEHLGPDGMRDPARVAAAAGALPLRLLGTRPIEEAISSAGGVRLEAMDTDLMLRRLPGVFCAGEMLDWEAPTGGYLLSASFASGHRAGNGAVRWLAEPPRRP